MKIDIFTNTPSVEAGFSRIDRSKKYDLTLHPFETIKKYEPAEPRDTFIYMDVTGITPATQKKQFRRLCDEGLLFGVLDPKGEIADPAQFFYQGAHDYISKELLKEGLTVKRIDQTVEYAVASLPEEEESCEGPKLLPEAAASFKFPLSGTDWKAVKTGKEYMFCFLYLELDNQKEIKSVFSGPRLEKFTSDFHNWVERTVADAGGKIWMWTGLGGVILFPFDGSNCSALVKGFSLMLNRKIISFEQFDYDILLSYKMAVHIGSTVYQNRGETGEIISDSVNSIFHLGQKFAKPGHFYLTEDVEPFIPEWLKGRFLPNGSYEGREILRMCRFH